MKIVFLGDVYGKSGRQAVLDSLDQINADHNPDFVVLNVDNAAHGNGITPKYANQFFEAGVDVMTSGDHVWDRREIIPYIEKESRLVRLMNEADHTPGLGYTMIEKNSMRLLVIHLAGNVMMSKKRQHPFYTIDQFLKDNTQNYKPDAILVDFHAEATSEKNAMGYFLDGRVSAVVGTHTHIPTADARIMPKGTAYITDVGMTGDYNSIIGATYNTAMKLFLEQNSKEHLKPSEGPGTAYGVFIETENDRAIQIKPIRYGHNVGFQSI